MSDNCLEISRETFDKMEVKAQMGVIYDYITDIHKRVSCIENQSKERMKTFFKFLMVAVSSGGGGAGIVKILEILSK
jgi:hypothetical protein